MEGDRVDGRVSQKQAIVVERVLAREDRDEDLGGDRVRGLAALDGRHVLVGQDLGQRGRQGAPQEV